MLRIAVAQTPGTRLEDWPRTLELAEELIARAAARAAGLVVFPECLWPAYYLGSVADYFKARQAGLPSDRWFLTQLRAQARAGRIGVCAGYVAERGGRLFNAACLISEAGELLGSYDKCFLWDFDHEFYAPGQALEPIASPWGPVGLLICADARLPEIAATLAARGARLFLQPTAWVNCGTAEKPWNPQPEFLVPERAREFGVPIAAASKCGSEGPASFVGSSLICSATGMVLARCGSRPNELLVADVEPRHPCPPQLTDRQRERLLGHRPPLPPAADVPPLVVALAHAECDPASIPADRPPNTPTLFVRPTERPARRPTRPTRGPDWLLLTGPAEGIQTLAKVRLVAVGDEDADCFAPLRAAALDGVHLAVVFGEGVTERTLRSRAAENRIFLIHASSTGLTAYDPRGEAVGEIAPDEKADAHKHLRLELAQAADKLFAPRTDPFSQRRPELYAF